MHQKTDGDAILRNVDIVPVIEKYVHLTKSGSFFKGVCPFHDDHEASLEVVPRKQIFKCHACGAGGDAFEFLKLKGIGFKEAVKLLGGDEFKTTTEKKPSKTAWKVILPPSEAGSFKHFKHGNPSKTWKWHNADGNLLSYTCRFDLPGGDKEVLPYSYCSNGTKNEWRWQGMAAPRPLYNLHKITGDKVVFVVEGEKTADALAEILPDLIITTWIGGANGLNLTDWTPLKGCKVIIWPDNDWQGTGAAVQITEILNPIATWVKWMRNPTDAPIGWDFADSGWDFETTKQWINSNRRSPQEPELDPVPSWADAADKWWVLRCPVTGEDKRYFFLRDGKFVGHKPPEKMSREQVDSALSDIELPPYEDFPESNPESNPRDIQGSHFKFLGFEKSENSGLAYYFFVRRTRNVVRISNSGISKTSLFQLAPLSWWEENFPKKNGFDLDAASDFLIQESQNKGIFSDKYIRGRGAWADDGRIVLHTGDSLIVDGKNVSLGDLKTKYIYERSERLEIETGEPATSKQAARLIDMLNLVSWERPISAHLLAGWCVIAPFCGALKWRPHIWITGSAGTGKSWVMHGVVRRLLGETAITAQGATSEAGLRQLLGHDAMPVEFDEAEGEGKNDSQRMQDVLSLARAASTDDGGKIIKGTAGHQSRTFSIRSCFAFASITPQVSGQADRSRVTMLQIRKEQDQQIRERNWTDLQRIYSGLMTDNFAKSIQARTINNLKTILANADTFASAAATVIGEQRSGDQLGAMLAGAYSLYRTDRITFDAAAEWVKSKDWSDERSLEGTKDEIQLIKYLMDQIVTVPLIAARTDRTVAELVAITQGISDHDVSYESAENHLSRLGIRTETNNILISNTSQWVKVKLSGTAWAQNHARILLRIQGAEAVDPMRFSGITKSRAVRIPIACLDV